MQNGLIANLENKNWNITTHVVKFGEVYYVDVFSYDEYVKTITCMSCKEALIKACEIAGF